MIELKRLTGKVLHVVLPEVGLGIQWISRKHRPKRVEITDAKGRVTRPIVMATTICRLFDSEGKLRATATTYASITEPRLLVTKARHQSLTRALEELPEIGKGTRAQVWADLLKTLPPEHNHFTATDVVQGKRLRKIFLMTEKLRKKAEKA